MNSQQQKRGRLLKPATYAADDSRLASAFVKLPRHLKKAPNRQFWGNRTRESNPLYGPERKAVNAGRLVIRAAIDTGDKDVIESTALDVSEYGDQIKEAMLADYTRWAEGLPKLSFPVAGVAVVKELALALSSVVEALVNRSPAAAEAAANKARMAITYLERFVAAARQYVATHTVIRAFR